MPPSAETAQLNWKGYLYLPAVPSYPTSYNANAPLWNFTISCTKYAGFNTFTSLPKLPSFRTKSILGIKRKRTIVPSSDVFTSLKGSKKVVVRK